MAFRPFLDTAARFLMAFFFIASGALKVFAFQPSAGALASIGLPNPQLFLMAFIVIEIGGGLGLLLGFGTRYVSAALIVFLILATIVIHARFISDPVSGPDQIIHIIKNIAMIGGLLKFVVDGGGALSVDNRLLKRPI
jgi:putative oxidoreductase